MNSQLLLPCYKIDGGNRLATSYSNKTNTARLLLQVVTSLLRADDIRLVGTTCCESVGLINLVTR